MANSKKYWKGLEQLNNDPKFLASSRNEFPEELPVDQFLGDKETLENSSTSRRDFLKYLGFGVAAASLAACESPVTKAIPYINKPEEITPGKANYYASTYYDGNDFAPILVKTREGRPIHVIGNKESKLTKGAINSRIAASVLSLYDNNRLKNPLKNGKATDWKTVDAEITKAIAEGKNIKLLTSSLFSDSTKQAFSKVAGEKVYDIQGNFKGVKIDTNFVEYDEISYSGMLDANETTFNKRAIPTYNFEKAKTIISVGADFMGNWLDTTMYLNDYAQTRKPDNDWMSKHFQFEANMSLSGTNADVRVPVKPSEYGVIVANIYKQLGGSVDAPAANANLESKIAAAVKALKDAKGSSIVICGSNNKNIQLIVNGINQLLGNYGNTINIVNHSNTKAGNDTKVNALVEEMSKGEVDVLFVYGVDPARSIGDKFISALSKVKTSVSFATKENETSKLCTYVCPDNHALESWNDYNPVDGYFTLQQPTISPLFNTRQAQESCLKWSSDYKNISYYDFIKETWKNIIFPDNEIYTLDLNFNEHWNKALHDGEICFEIPHAEVLERTTSFVNVTGISSIKIDGAGVDGDFELELTQNASVGAGAGADNPWLQETPDPITKVTWDNYVTMHPSEMKERGYNTQLGQESPANLISVTVNGKTIDSIPVVAQPGQAKGTIGIALGYGKVVGNMAEPTGKNAYPLVENKDGVVSYYVGATIVDVAGTYPIAATQTHQTVMGRDSVVRETTLATYKKGNKEAYNPEHKLATHENGQTVKKNIKEFDLWKAHPVENIGHRWGMSIDMNACIGCSTCITSCNSENNVPVVGKDEVRRGREMHWMRIDRYYSTDADIEDKSIAGYRKMEDPADNPQVVHQPMMCQHCNHAGCETVCPVAATTHSNEGLNMMAYNRCIGTRYCANNCAYKVRRFNWFNYMAYDKFTEINPSQDDLGRMVLNPDVVVRARGVMEKCSMCVQRIQAGKLDAKKAGTKVQDGAIQTACSASCPTNAITFGDLNDTTSKINGDMNHNRAYRVIEEVGQQPNVYYLTKVRNLENNEA